MSETSATKRVVAEIAAERRRQVEQEGWAPRHDDQHTNGALVRAAASYALGKRAVTNIGGQAVNIWPWEEYWFKPTSRRRDLIKASALIVAEIERLDRAAIAKAEHKPVPA